MLCVHKLLLLEWHTLSITYATGSKYGGDWENNERHGKGVMTRQNGTTFHDGSWHEGKIIFTLDEYKLLLVEGTSHLPLAKKKRR